MTAETIAFLVLGAAAGGFVNGLAGTGTALFALGFYLVGSALPAFERPTPALDAGIGLTGGILGGAASVSGAIPSMWLSIRPWTKAETRAVLQPYNIAILSTAVCLLAAKGAYDSTAVRALLVTVPCGLIAAQIGIAVFRRLSDTGFRRLLIVLTLFMGLGILVSEFT